MSYLGHKQSDVADTEAAYTRMDNKPIVIYTTTKQGKDCKGICHRFYEYPPGRQARYKQHAFCSRCDAWMNRDSLLPHKTMGLICPCCKRRPRQKNFKQNAKAKAKL